MNDNYSISENCSIKFDKNSEQFFKLSMLFRLYSFTILPFIYIDCEIKPSEPILDKAMFFEISLN